VTAHAVSAGLPPGALNPANAARPVERRDQLRVGPYPRRLHSAEKRNTLDFTLLDRRDFSPVGYKRVNKTTGEEVPWGEIVKGYEYEEGSYVALSEEDFRRANVDATQTVDILSFVDAGDVAPVHFDTPYYLSPGKRGEKGYALLRETLRRSGKAAIANVVIRTRQYVAMLIPVGAMLVLNTLRYADEIRSMDEFELPEDTKASAREVDVALRLVKEMSEKWDPSKYRDTYRDDILARIEKKVQGGETRQVAEPGEAEAPQPKSAKVIDLMALLERSVKKEGGKPRARTTRARSTRGVRKSSKAAAAHHQRTEPAERRKRA
jgi:DNA end-binding protein Ku